MVRLAQMMRMFPALDRLREKARQWKVTIQETRETCGSLLAFGVSHGSQVVLKIIKEPGDEWRCGEVLRAFGGHGTAQVLEFAPGAVLLERLDPGKALVDLVRHGKDQEATEILAELMREMAGNDAPDHCPTLFDWAGGFDRYKNTGDKQITHDLVNEATDWYQRLAGSQRAPMLLHGDLHHYNVLLDSKRGWIAIDPKGVVGEREYEVGAILRNPTEQPDLFLSTFTIERRLKVFTSRLNLNYERALSWAFAQGVLSAIWDVEDGNSVPPDHSALKLARTIRPLLPGST
jgi:streptomycin 6-kinase